MNSYKIKEIAIGNFVKPPELDAESHLRLVNYAFSPDVPLNSQRYSFKITFYTCHVASVCKFVQTINVVACN